MRVLSYDGFGSSFRGAFLVGLCGFSCLLRFVAALHRSVTARKAAVSSFNSALMATATSPAGKPRRAAAILAAKWARIAAISL
jgi:hypothetical protein